MRNPARDSGSAGMLARMTWKFLAAMGGLLLVLGVGTFLAGAFVLTNNARHADISPAVYLGLGISLVAVVMLILAGFVAAWTKRS